MAAYFAIIAALSFFKYGRFHMPFYLPAELAGFTGQQRKVQQSSFHIVCDGAFLPGQYLLPGFIHTVLYFFPGLPQCYILRLPANAGHRFFVFTGLVHCIKKLFKGAFVQVVTILRNFFFFHCVQF